MLSYKSSGLCFDGLPLQNISNAEGVKTPFYLYSKETLIKNFTKLNNALTSQLAFGQNKLIAFAVKACPNINILKVFADLGCGADVVSGGELLRAIKATIAAEKIVFAGVGKTIDELIQAIKLGVSQVNVESFEELTMLNGIARSFNIVCDVAIRLNPDVDAGTHSHITTGTYENKFGIPIAEMQKLKDELPRLTNVRLVGFSIHIGSQITDAKPLKTVFRNLAETFITFRSLGYKLQTIDFGGGLGISYNGESVLDPIHYAGTIADVMSEFKIGTEVKVIIEPGRFLSASAGVLVSKVTLIKQTSSRNKQKKFAVVDAGMNDLMRPALYGAFHNIRTITIEERKEIYDVVGPICESTCCFAKNLELSTLTAGDLIAFENAGAYGASMSSRYNTRPLPMEILINEHGQIDIIRRAESFEEIIKLEL